MMDSRLDSIFRTSLHPVEKADTWQGIRREEPQNDQRRKHHEKQIIKESSPEDNATLSVIALHGFLKTLLLRAGEKPEPFLPQAAQEHPVYENTNKDAARAANAYQNTAKAMPGAHIDLNDSVSAATLPAGPVIPLSMEELRIIHQLLHDVETLAHRGISTINLYPEDRFLDSLVTGVREALSSG